MKKNIGCLVILGLLLFCLSVWQVLQEDRLFSPQENRMLEQKPSFTWEALFAGTYTTKYETYLTDQFPERDRWIRMKTALQKRTGKKDENGVFFLADQTLIEQHLAQEIDEEKAARKIRRLQAEVTDLSKKVTGDVYVMLVPTADTIWKEKLPRFAVVFDQLAFLENVREALSHTEAVYVDAAQNLAAHKTEKIYYGTDHHWTTLGAFYGYEAWAREWASRQHRKGANPAWEMRTPQSYERTVVSDTFYGTLQAKVNLKLPYDTIEQFRLPGQGEAEVRFVSEERKSDSLYFPQRLETKDQYAYFLDGNYPLLEIEGFGNPQETLLVIKDSYANCMAPFLLEHYGKIILADPRYYRADIAELTEQYPITDVFYLFDVIHFIG